MSTLKSPKRVTELDAQAAFWTQRLSGELPFLDIRPDRPRPPVQAFIRSRERLDIGPDETASLERACSRNGVGLFVTLLAAYKALLARHTAQDDIIVGSVSGDSERANGSGEWERFSNPVVLRTDVAGDPSVRDLISRVAATVETAAAYRNYPFDNLVSALGELDDSSRSPIFQTMFILCGAPGSVSDSPISEEQLAVVDEYAARCDLAVVASAEGDALSITCDYDAALFEAKTIRRLLWQFKMLLEGLETLLEHPISMLPLVTAAERQQLLVGWNDTRAPSDSDTCIHQLFEAQVQRTADAVAVAFEDEVVSYRELNRRANKLAHRLRALDIGPDQLVGLCAERSIEMIVGMLGILKAGGAYVPLDPRYPRERLAYILADAGVSVLVTQARLAELIPEPRPRVLYLDGSAHDDPADADRTPDSGVNAENLAYVIYTSGSTGKPKGVMVEHRNVVAFFIGMDNCIGDERPGVWLAVTSISFDISVFELLWTLARGFKVVLHAEDDRAIAVEPDRQTNDRSMEFSLFYFASEDGKGSGDRYHLLIEGARFADQHGFAAVWTPERHFHPFGGLYPNPSVTSALLAGLTERIHIRAGSVVLPLHSPIRVAEEWAVVDNFSRGRIGISFASGWHDRDFVFAPENYADRKEVMRREIDTVRRLWRGETLLCKGGAGTEVEIKIFPQPIQPELPVWVTAAGGPDTFSMAGEIGASVLTHLLFQSLDDIAAKIAIYREAWQKGGHGPGEGHVTLMLHTFIGDDLTIVRDKVRKPFCDYLKSSVDLIKQLAKGLGQEVDARDLQGEDLDALLAHAFDRYFEASGLFGTPHTCLDMIDRLKAIGVDEVACLIDFGVDVESVLASLNNLETLRELSNQKAARDRAGYSVSELIGRHGVSHLQCTPSLAKMLALDPATLEALKPLQKVMLGGETLPASLAAQLGEVVTGEIWNMYGPTETTIWSTTQRINGVRNAVPIGRPIANTEIYILDRHLEPTPVGIPGELFIGGAGVARGYHGRGDLTAERFIPDPFSGHSGARLYRTGDIARYRPDGRIEFLGRLDHQVKIRGCRVELGEIEATLLQHQKLKEAVVLARENGAGEHELAAYVIPVDREAVGARELRAFLLERLPNYMVPAAFMALDSLPTTAGGKVDRQALPEPVAWQSAEVRSEPPRGPVEELLAGLWSALLGVEHLSVSDNFFELGGHSLLAIQLISRLREIFGIDLSLGTTFEAPTIRRLAAALVESESTKGQTERIASVALRVDRMSRDEVEARLAM